MKKLIVSVVLLLACVAGVHSQYRKPTVDRAGELAGLRRCFVLSDTADNRKLLIKELNRQYPEVEVVERPVDAEFFLVSRVYDDGYPDDFKTTELVAYVKKDRQNVIVWTEWESDDGSIRTNENNLIRHLVKAVRKAPANR